jgi:hypothetical protein
MRRKFCAVAVQYARRRALFFAQRLASNGLPAVPQFETSPASGVGSSQVASGSPKQRRSSGKPSWWETVFSSWQKGVATGLGAVMCVGGLAFVLWTPFKEDTLENSSHLAQRTLSDAKVKEQALQLSKEVVENILRDNRSVELLVTVITRLLRQEDSKIAVTSFIRGVFEDHYTQEITKKFVLKIVLDPWIQEQLDRIAFDLTVNLLKDPKTKKVVTDLLVQSASEALADAKLQSTSAQAVRSTVYYTVNPWAAPPA